MTCTHCALLPLLLLSPPCPLLLPPLPALSLPPLPCLSVSLLPGGGVGAAKVAGSNVIPALPEPGQSESELSQVEGGAQATGNQLLLGVKARPGGNRGPMG